MANPIVTTNVTQTVAPAPSTLQRTGAIISQGGTTTDDGTLSLITQESDLTSLLETTHAITSMSWSGGTVTVATTSPHGLPVGQTISLTIAGVTPTAYNGTYDCAITGASAFTYALASNPGSVTVQGTYINHAVAELAAQINTFFAQGSSVSVYVLELGPGDAEAGVTALDTFLTANPGIIYCFAVPDSWDSESTFKTLIDDYASLTAKTYFFARSTLGTYSGYTDQMKAAFVLVNAPATSEPDVIACFWKALSYNPTSSNLVTPMTFSYVYGVTPYPTFNNGSTLTALLAANMNYIGTGAEGGISTSIIRNGTLADGNAWNYYYSIDWVQINAELNLANEVINGSNNPAAPLFYNQSGINRLQARAVSTMQTAISYGLALGNVVTTQLTQADFVAAYERGDFAGSVVVNAVPFTSYTSLNPSDYSQGRYGGISIVYAPQLGFTEIIVNINATQVV